MKTYLIFGAIGGLVLCTFHFVRYLIDPMWVLGEHNATFGTIGFVFSIAYMLTASFIVRHKRANDQINYIQAFKMLFLIAATMTIMDLSYDAVFRFWKGKELKVVHEKEIKEMISEGNDYAFEIGLRPNPPKQKEMDTDYTPLVINNYSEKVEERYQYLMEPYSFPQFILGLLTSILGVALLSMLLALFVRSRKPRVATEPHLG